MTSARTTLQSKTALALSGAPLPLVGSLAGLALGQGLGEYAAPTVADTIGVGPGAVHDQLVSAGQPVPPAMQAVLDARAANIAHAGELLGAGAGAIGGNVAGQFGNSVLGRRNHPAPAFG
jgi:hypothetical protein